MLSFRQLTAIACPLPIADIDTDQLCPARFMNRPRAQGYGEVLLYDLRQQPDFPLNNPACAGAGILVTQRNFGNGSSREAAVYALMDAGIRCVIAPSFADIFASNAVGNGLLPAIAADADVRALLTMLADGAVEVTVDLGACEIISPAGVFYFTTDSFWREKLLNGWDDVDLTRAHQSEIDTFVATDRATRAWAWRDLG